MKKQIMVRAWEIAKAAVAQFGGKAREYFAESLRIAWTEAKTPKTRKLRSAEIAFLRRFVADTLPNAVNLFDSQTAKGNATVTEKIGFVTMMIGNIDVEVTANGNYHGMKIDMWYCGKPIAEVV